MRASGRTDDQQNQNIQQRPPCGFSKDRLYISNLSWKKKMPSPIQRNLIASGTLLQKGRFSEERPFLTPYYFHIVPGQGWRATTGRPRASRPWFGCWKSQTDPLVFFFFFQNAVSKYGAQFRGNSQHDALEFLLWLLDRVHEDLEGSTRAPGSEKVSHS